MNKLKQEIKNIEAEIIFNNQIILYQSHLLKRKTISPKFIYTGLLISFTLGYLFSRKKKMKQIILSLITTSLKAKMLLKKVEFFLPFFIF